MKTCNQCGIETDNFSKRSASKDGLTSICKACKSANDADAYRRDPEKRIKQANDWKNNNREAYRTYRRAYKADKRENDMQWKLKERGRKRRYDVVTSRGLYKNGKYLDVLGCTAVFFRTWIESQFKPGMTWENWGPVWHIDEIIPCEAFNLEDEWEDRVCWHYTNSRPLSAKENMSRGGLLNAESIAAYRTQIAALVEDHKAGKVTRPVEPTQPVVEARVARVVKTYEKQKKFTDVEVEYILAEHKAGQGRQAIAETMGVKIECIDYVLRKNNARSRNVKYTDEQKTRAIELRRQGVSQADIEIQTGVGIGTQTNIFRDAGIKLDSSQHAANMRTYSEADYQRVRDLRTQGVILREIANQTGISLAAVKRILNPGVSHAA